MKTILLLALVALLGCDYQPSSDEVVADKTERSMKEASAQVGMPAIHNFTELRLVRTIYELRDDAKLQTWTYTVDMNGNKHLLCRSIGYGVPYATQFSNPERAQHPYSGVYYNLPQAEPNGLFMPNSAEGTWVVCQSAKGDPKPVYVEPRVIVSPFDLEEKPTEVVPVNVKP